MPADCALSGEQCQVIEDVARALRALGADQAVEGIAPLRGFLRIDVGDRAVAGTAEVVCAVGLHWTSVIGFRPCLVLK